MNFIGKIFVILIAMSGLLLAQERPQLLLQKGHGGSTEILATSPLREAGFVATAGSDGTVKVWSLQDRHVVRTVYDEKSFPNPEDITGMKAAAFSPDRSWVVTQDSDGIYRRFTLADGRLVGRFEDEKAKDTGSVLLTDGNALIYFHRDALLRTDLNGQVIASTPWSSPLRDRGLIALSPDAESLVLKTESGISVLDAKTLEERSFKELNSLVQGVSFSDDGQRIALSTNTAFAILNGASLEVERLIEKPRELSSQRFLPVWDGSEVTLIPFGSGNGAAMLRVESKSDAFTPLGEEFVATSRSAARNLHILGGYGGTTLLIDSETGEREELASDIAGFTALALNPVSKDLFSGSRNGRVVRWDSQTGRLEQRYEGLKAWVSSVDVSPDGSKLLAADYSYGDVYCWDIKTGKVISEFHRYTPGTRSGANFGRGIEFAEFISPDRYLTSFTSNANLRLVDALTGKEVDVWPTGSTPLCASVNASGTRVAVGYSKGMTEMSLSSKRDVLSTSVRDRLTSVLYGPDGRTVFAGSYDGALYRWDSSDPKNRAEVIWRTGSRQAITRIALDGQNLAVLTRDGKQLVIQGSGKVLSEKSLDTDRLSRPVELGGAVLAGTGPDMTLDFFDTGSGARLGRLVSVRDNSGWVAMNQGGEFDGNDVGLQTINFELKGELFGVDQFLNDYFRPGVLARLLPGEEPQAGSARTAPELTASSLKMPPLVEVLEPRSGDVIERDKLQVKIKVTDRGAGFSDVALIHNGHKLPDSKRISVNGDTFLFTVRPVQGKNEFRATAFDGSRSVEARQDRVRVTAPNVEAAPPKLHLLSVGVDEYSSGLSLEFAQADAKSVAELFAPGVYAQGYRRLLSNEEATLSGIQQAIKEVAAVAQPQDAFVFYLAGHGTVIGEAYYFLPHDVKIESDESVSKSALSSEELGLSLRSIPATKQLMVLDSCRSGAAVGVVGRYFASRGGLEEIRSQQLLARSSGTFLIAATKGEEYAYEIPQLGHGVLTFAILEALGVKQDSTEGSQPAAAEGITANDLLRAVSDRVPELSEKYQGVRQQVIQYSSGEDFPLVRAR